MTNNNAKTAMEIFVELKRDTEDPWNRKLVNGLAFLALSIEELHTKMNSQEGDKPAPRADTDNSIEL